MIPLQTIWPACEIFLEKNDLNTTCTATLHYSRRKCNRKSSLLRFASLVFFLWGSLRMIQSEKVCYISRVFIECIPNGQFLARPWGFSRFWVQPQVIQEPLFPPALIRLPQTFVCQNSTFITTSWQILQLFREHLHASETMLQNLDLMWERGSALLLDNQGNAWALQWNEGNPLIHHKSAPFSIGFYYAAF